MKKKIRMALEITAFVGALVVIGKIVNGAVKKEAPTPVDENMEPQEPDDDYYDELMN